MSVFSSWLTAHLILLIGDKSCRGQCSPVYELHECYFCCPEAGDIPEFKWVLPELQELYKVLFFLNTEHPDRCVCVGFGLRPSSAG